MSKVCLFFFRYAGKAGLILFITIDIYCTHVYGYHPFFDIDSYIYFSSFLLLVKGFLLYFCNFWVGFAADCGADGLYGVEEAYG